MKLFTNYNFVCPSCKNRFITKDKLFFCNNKKCKQFGEVDYLKNGKPILMNFENSVFCKSNLLSSDGISILNRNVFKNYFTNFLKKLLNGSNKTTKHNLENIVNKLTNIPDPKILIVGGGSIGVGVEILYENFNDNIMSFDVYDSKYTHFIGDCTSIPFADNNFDFILIQAVLEHVIDPNIAVNEIHRTLKLDGLVYAETPFLQHVHEGAYDFTRYTVLGHRILFKNFEKISMGYIGGVGQSMIWSIEYFSRSLFRSKIIGKIFKLLFFWLRIIESIIPDSYNEDGACGAFFYGTKKSFEEKHINEYITDYQGHQK